MESKVRRRGRNISGPESGGVRMARQLRPRVLAAGFGIYFAIIGIASWQFAQGLSAAWDPADITRWIYTTYMLVPAIFLVGLARLRLNIPASFSRPIPE